MDESRLERDLAAWPARPDPATFPYEQVVDEYHRVGKHFVAEGLLKYLDIARSAAMDASTSANTTAAGATESAESLTLQRFLDVMLDKRDGVYDYQTYLALSLLPLPRYGEPSLGATGTDTSTSTSTSAAQLQHDRVLVQLTADALGFELAALDGHTDRFPHMRPDPSVAAKRCRLGLRSLGPVLERLGLAEPGSSPELADDTLAAARWACDAVRADASPTELRTLNLSILPVWTSHDEYLFIRVLQSFETVFALLAVRLQAALAALAGGRGGEAAREVRGAESGLEESFRLFSLLATMQVGSFQEFREFTEGASAIQSRNYKLVEALCRVPDADRLDSPAFRSVPELRARVVEGTANLDDSVWDACHSGTLADAEREEVLLALRGFAAKLLQWRQTHYRLAVRMLGDRPGTGYTEGTPYLKEVRTIPVFQKTDGLS